MTLRAADRRRAVAGLRAVLALIDSGQLEATSDQRAFLAGALTALRGPARVNRVVTRPGDLGRRPGCTPR